MKNSNVHVTPNQSIKATTEKINTHITKDALKIYVIIDRSRELLSSNCSTLVVETCTYFSFQPSVSYVFAVGRILIGESGGE